MEGSNLGHIIDSRGWTSSGLKQICLTLSRPIPWNMPWKINMFANPKVMEVDGEKMMTSGFRTFVIFEVQNVNVQGL